MIDHTNHDCLRFNCMLPDWERALIQDTAEQMTAEMKSLVARMRSIGMDVKVSITSTVEI